MVEGRSLVTGLECVCVRYHLPYEYYHYHVVEMEATNDDSSPRKEGEDLVIDWRVLLRSRDVNAHSAHTLCKKYSHQ